MGWSNSSCATAVTSSLALAFGFCAEPCAAEQPDAPAPDTIIVDGTRAQRTTLGRVLTPVIDTPQAVSSLSNEELVNRGVTNLNDALRSIPGISLGAGETSFQGNNAILRGFTTRNDQFLDNIRDFGYYFRDTFNDQSIDVYKGPSSILFGRGSTGGVIHRVSKAPFDTTVISGDATFGLDETRRGTLDVNIADIAGDGTALRLNAVAHRSMLEDRDVGLSRRWGVAPSLIWGLDGPTQVTVSYVHQEEGNIPDYGIPWIAGRIDNPGRPAPVERSTYYGFTNDYFDTNVDIVTLKIEHTLSSAITLRSQTRYSNNERQFRYSEAVIPAGTPANTPLASITVSRNLFEGFSTDTFVQTQNDFVATFNTGPFGHKLISGVEVGRERSTPVYVTNVNAPTTSLVAPDNPGYDGAANEFVRLRADGTAFSVGVYAIDAISFGEKWRAVVGLRWDRFDADYDSTGFNPDGTVSAVTIVDRVDQDLSYRGALIYKATGAISLYGAYGTSFNPSGEGIESFISAGRSVAQANINLDPETSRSAEIGAKVSLFADRALLTTSLFRIDKNNVRVPDPTTPGFNALGGKQRVDGAEIELSGEPLPGWTLRAGYTYLDSRTLESSPGGPLVGEPLIITPTHSGVISSWFAFTQRLSAGVSAVAVSDRLGQNTPASYLVAPGFVIVDFGAKFALTDAILLRVNVNNISDKLYYDQLHPAHVIPGAGRTALAAIAFSF